MATSLSTDLVAETLDGGGLRSDAAIEAAGEGMGSKRSTWALRIDLAPIPLI
jgi:hypothetical protein